MARRWRWAVVAAVTLVLLALPSAAALLPVSRSSISAHELLARIQHSAQVGFSGYAEASGGLSLPLSTQLNSVNDLFGGTTRLRVWWRASDAWRVDQVDLLGENDVHHDARGTWTWSYQSNTATRTAEPVEPIVRLPRAADLVPAALARRLISQESASDVVRLADARIAGRDAAGLRVRVSDPGSTIDHIDVWALASSGLALRVRVYGVASSVPVLQSTMLDLAVSSPSASSVAFMPPRGATVSSGDEADIVAAIDQFGTSHPPARVAGLNRELDLQLGAVGVYGRGVTLLVALPLPDRVAESVARQLASTTGTSAADAAVKVGVGPVNLYLTTASDEGARWLLVGTVTAATLDTAAAELPPAQGFG